MRLLVYFSKKISKGFKNRKNVKKYMNYWFLSYFPSEVNIFS